jgi:peptide/nickel transport system permease protein
MTVRPEAATVPDIRGAAVSAGRIEVATPRQLMWWRFRKHRLAVASAIVLLGFYVVALFAPFFATAVPTKSEAQRSLMPPMAIHWFDDGSFAPHVLKTVGKRDLKTFKRVYVEDPKQKYPLRLFVRGFKYKALWFFPTDIHLLGLEGAPADENLFLLGTDLQGRDVFSRLLFATQVSMSIGLVGVLISLVLGVVLGGMSGFFGGLIDTAIQRLIEILRSIPTIPLWMGLAAALPRDWSVLQIYFAITIIISVFGWTELARVVRGRFLALREEDFVMAARLSGASRPRVIYRHMLPSFFSHIIAASTLAVPEMIIAETALSFLGLGLQPPAVSYGVMLEAAQNVQTVATTPWLMVPAVPVIVAVLAFNFLGDGLRDAADPYSQ